MTHAPQRATETGSEVRQLSLGKRLLVWPFALLTRLWLKTLRMPCPDEERGDLRDVDDPTIVIVWHNRLALAAEYVRRYRRGRRMCGLVSGSRDGAWLEVFFRAIGILVVRGSSNRRGPQAIRDLAHRMEAGHDVGITPDGSRGPCYEMKPGAALVAKITKAPVLLLSFEFSSAWRLNSWDGFYLPKPFSRVLVRGKRLAGGSLEGLKTNEAVSLMERDLMQLTKDTVPLPSYERAKKKN